MADTMTRTAVRPTATQLAAADRAAIEALRAEVASAKAAEPARPTVEQVSRIVADVRSLASLGDTDRKSVV